MGSPAGEWEAIHDKGAPFVRTVTFSGRSTHLNTSAAYVISLGGENLITLLNGAGITMSTSDGELRMDLLVPASQFDALLTGEYFHKLDIWDTDNPLNLTAVVRGPFMLRRDGT